MCGFTLITVTFILGLFLIIYSKIICCLEENILCMEKSFYNFKNNVSRMNTVLFLDDFNEIHINCAAGKNSV